MHKSGNIKPIAPDELKALHSDQLDEQLAAMQRMLDGDRVPIPDEDLPKVRKMNRKARRRWYAKQRRKR